VIGSLSIHGFSIFKLKFDVEDVLTSVKDYLTSKKKKQFENIQQAPQGLNLEDFPATRFTRYQVRLLGNELKPLFQSIQDHINENFGHEIVGTCKLEHYKILVNDDNNSLSEQYWHTDYSTPTIHPEVHSIMSYKWHNPRNSYRFKDYFGTRTYLKCTIDLSLVHGAIDKFEETATLFGKYSYFDVDNSKKTLQRDVITKLNIAKKYVYDVIEGLQSLRHKERTSKLIDSEKDKNVLQGDDTRVLLFDEKGDKEQGDITMISAEQESENPERIAVIGEN
jgi:hypothetical protein